MMLHVLSVLALLPVIKGLCYSPLIHGFAPDVILPSMLSSEIYCPPPHVFDHFVCMCVDPSQVKVRVPTEGRTSLELSLLNNQRRLSAYRIAPFAGLPDMHIQGHVSSWRPVTGTYRLRPSSSGGAGTGRGGGRVVPALNIYGSYNVPASSEALKAAAKAKLMTPTLPSKEQEILDKVRWREQLKRESVVAAAAAVELAAVAAAAAASAAGPMVPSDVGVGVGGGTALDTFMRDTLRRILYGY